MVGLSMSTFTAQKILISKTTFLQHSEKRCRLFVTWCNVEVLAVPPAR